ncbi:MAG: PIN domain-containing protein [Anaerolineae bacterium]|nr:PIN domain-containing protein [Anaerolineae bacterium]
MATQGIGQIDALFDSDIIIDSLRQEPQAIAWLNTIRHWHVGISAIVWMEIIAGAQSGTDLRQLVRSLTQYHTFHIVEADSRWAVQQMTAYRVSHGVGLADCLIAAVAARTKLPFYTRNLKHYAPFPDINTIRPY